MIDGVRRAGPAALPALLTVLAQIWYPLLSGPALHALTATVVVLFCLTSVVHAASIWGWAAAFRFLLAAAGIGLAAETLGVHTGVPFGAYDYAGTLGPHLLGVPVVVPLAWAMMAYPSLVLGRVLAGRARPDGAGGPLRSRRWIVALTGGWTLAAWDLFLDPQMVSAGHWTFQHPAPGLPGLSPLPTAALADGVAAGTGIPLTNHLGWLAVAVVLIGVLDRVLPGAGASIGATTTRGRAARLGVPVAMLGWTWLGSGLALGLFLDLPGAAAWGFVGMALTVVPFLLVVLPSPPAPARVPAVAVRAR